MFCLRLAKLLGDDKYERFAVTVLRLAASQLRRHPQGFGRALSALEFHLAATKEIVVIGRKGMISSVMFSANIYPMRLSFCLMMRNHMQLRFRC